MKRPPFIPAIVVAVLLLTARLFAAAYVIDTFTDSAKALNSHTGETGATWATQTGSANNAVISDSNTVRAGIVGTNTYSYSSGTPGTAEYDVDCDFVTKTTVAASDFTTVWARMSTGAETGYRVYYDPGTPEFGLQKVTAGAGTQLDTYSAGLSTSTTYHMKFQVRNAAKKFYIDGTQRLTTSDDTITQVGKAGLGWGGGTTGGNTIGVHIDNFIVTFATGGSGLLLKGVALQLFPSLRSLPCCAAH